MQTIYTLIMYIYFNCIRILMLKKYFKKQLKIYKILTQKKTFIMWNSDLIFLYYTLLLHDLKVQYNIVNIVIIM